MPDALTPLRDALDAAARAGRTIRVWLRDDDCVAPTRRLDRLAALIDPLAVPVLLAVIPAKAEEALGDWVADHSGVTPCQHGIAHDNHARAGERALELGGTRDAAALRRDLAEGGERLRALFGGRLAPILVPPWNRIDPALVPDLPALGYRALSTIAPSRLGDAIPRIDCDLDLMDWRAGRVGKPLATLASAAAEIVARQDRLGLLTHHLVHDEAAWASLQALLAGLAAHAAVRFVSAQALLGPEAQ